MSSNNDSASACSWARCSGLIESSDGLNRGHLGRELFEQLVEGLRVAGEHVPELLHELLESRVDRFARLALLDHPVEGVERLPGPFHLLGVRVGQGLGHLVEPALRDLLRAAFE